MEDNKIIKQLRAERNQYREAFENAQNQIVELTSERDSYKKAFEELHDMFVNITDKIKFIK